MNAVVDIEAALKTQGRHRRRVGEGLMLMSSKQFDELLREGAERIAELERTIAQLRDELREAQA